MSNGNVPASGGRVREVKNGVPAREQEYYLQLEVTKYACAIKRV